MEEKKDFEEVVKEMEQVAANAPKEGEKPEPRELSMEELAALDEARQEAAEAEKKAEEEKKRAEREKNPHGLIRSTVAATPVPELAAGEGMADYQDELEASFRQIHVGDVLTGRVIDVNETGVLMDLDYFAPGKIPVEEMSADPHFDILSAVKIGDEFQGTVIKRDDGSGNILLSRKQADDELSWEKLKKMMEEKTVVEGKITEVVKAGAILYVEGIRGFIPASKLALEYVENTEEYLNRTVRVQVISVEEDTKRLVLSAKELLQEQAIEEKNRKISRLVPGNIVEGTVETLKDYGAFVDIGDGISGLLHISQIREERVKNIRAVLKEGQKVRAVITKVDNGKVSLSMKALIEQLATEKAEEDPSEYSDNAAASTSLADLLKGIKL